LNEPLYLRRVRPDSTMTGRIGWKHVYGHLAFLYVIPKSLLSLEAESEDFTKAITKYIVQIERTAAGELKALDEEECILGTTALSADKRKDFILILEYLRQIAVVLDRENEKKKLIEEQKKQLLSEIKKSQALQKKLNNFHRSTSYRLGRFITWPVRQIKRLLKKIHV